MFLRWEGGGSDFERPTARYSVPPGEVRELKGKGETAEIPLAINTLGGTAGCCCSHINQGGGGQVTEPGGAEEEKNRGEEDLSEEKRWSWDSPLRAFTFSPPCSRQRKKKTTLMERAKARGRRGLNERKEQQGKVNLITEARYGSDVS